MCVCERNRDEQKGGVAVGGGGRGERGAGNRRSEILLYYLPFRVICPQRFSARQ